MTISSKRILESAEPSSAAEEIAGNEDLVREILLHLPVKSLLRFESVSKKWLSFISDPYFARNYVRHHSTEFENDVVAINLAFDPLKSPHYKLICLRTVHETETLTYQIDIYSSETGSWRPPISGDPFIFTASLGMSFRAPVYWRGAIHWYSEEETSLYFNTDTECLKTMPMPPIQEGFHYNNVGYFGESRGHLHLIVIDEPSATEFDVLELETDYSRWFVGYSVNLDAVMMTFPPDVTWVRSDHTDAFTVGCVVQADREKESTLVLFLSGKAVSFNLHDKTAKKLCDLLPCYKIYALALHYEWLDAYQYIETPFNI